MEAPELEHLGVNLYYLPLDVRRVEFLEALVGVGGQGLQRAVGRDESSRLRAEFMVQDLGWDVKSLELRVQGLPRQGGRRAAPISHPGPARQELPGQPCAPWLLITKFIKEDFAIIA